MANEDKNQDGQLTNAEVVEQTDPKVVTVPSGDGEVEIEVQAGKTVIAPTSDEESDDK